MAYRPPFRNCSFKDSAMRESKGEVATPPITMPVSLIDSESGQCLAPSRARRRCHSTTPNFVLSVLHHR